MAKKWMQVFDYRIRGPFVSRVENAFDRINECDMRLEHVLTEWTCREEMIHAELSRLAALLSGKFVVAPATHYSNSNAMTVPSTNPPRAHGNAASELAPKASNT